MPKLPALSALFYKVTVPFFVPGVNTIPSDQLEKVLVASFNTCIMLSNKQMTKVLIRLCGCTGRSVPLLFTNTKDRFSLAKAQIIWALSNEC